MSTVDVSTWKSRNMWPLPDGSLAVRPGLRSFLVVSNSRAWFSLTEPNTGEVWHYIVTHANGSTAKINVYDEAGVLLQAYDTGSLVRPEVVTFGTALDFLVISSPSFPTAFGFIGGGLIKALKQDSLNTGTTAIDVPQGLCVGWAGRIAYASGSALFFSDPVTVTGGDPRTVVAENQLDLGSVIRGLHVNAGGALVAVTENGVYALSEQAAAVGQVVIGDVQRLTDYRATRYGVTCSSFGRVWGLTRKGFRLVDQEGAEEVELDDPHMPVGNGERIHCEDYSFSCRLYATGRGPLVSYPRATSFYHYDVARRFGSWWATTHGLYDDEVVGTGSERDGSDIIGTVGSAYRVHGNYDGLTALGTEYTVKGWMMGRLPSPVEGSPVVRRIDIASDTGGNILAAVRGEAKTATTTQQGAVIGTGTWNGSTVEEPPLQSARFHYSTRTDDIALEAGAEDPLSRVDPRVSVEVRGPGKRGRP